MNTHSNDQHVPISYIPPVSKVKLATVVVNEPKAAFSIATTKRCRGGFFFFPKIAPLYP